ncbi:hypothetical protein DSO57_1010947 [Entomophthora muscae]|uniref:Uncharacterized protein n=1 Tax=Entomophthora muscae TaxID=34485 RepID=A0ACC2TI90_9FUNG|nr:hypothetical protein DSO57_1010947 [Entomophthora muscae]
MCSLKVVFFAGFLVARHVFSWKKESFNSLGLCAQQHVELSQAGFKETANDLGESFAWTGYPLVFSRYHEEKAMAVVSKEIIGKHSKGIRHVSSESGYYTAQDKVITDYITCMEYEECFISVSYAKEKWELTAVKKIAKRPMFMHVTTPPKFTSQQGNYSLHVLGPANIRIIFKPIVWGFWSRFFVGQRYSAYLPYYICQGVFAFLKHQNVPDGWISYQKLNLPDYH